MALEVEPPNLLRQRNTAHRYFEGQRDGAQFTIWRILSYGNGFLPRVHVTAAPAAGGARISVRMHPPIGGMIMVALVSVVFTAATIAGVAAGVPFGAVAPPMIMVLFVDVLGVFLFDYEAKKARQKLLELFSGALVTPQPAAASSWPNG